MKSFKKQFLRLLIFIPISITLTLAPSAFAYKPMCTVESPSLDALIEKLNEINNFMNQNPNCVKGEITEHSTQLGSLIHQINTIRSHSALLSDEEASSVAMGLGEVSLNLENIMTNHECSSAQKIGFFESFISSLNAFAPFIINSSGPLALPYALQIQLLTSFITSLYNYYKSLTPDMSSTKVQSIFLKSFCYYYHIYPSVIKLLDLKKLIKVQSENLEKMQTQLRQLPAESESKDIPSDSSVVASISQIKNIHSLFTAKKQKISEFEVSPPSYCLFGINKFVFNDQFEANSSSVFSSADLVGTTHSIIDYFRSSTVTDLNLAQDLDGIQMSLVSIQLQENNIKKLNPTPASVCKNKQEQTNIGIKQWVTVLDTLFAQLDKILNSKFLFSHNERLDLMNKIFTTQEDLKTLENLNSNPAEKGIALQILADINFMLFGNGVYMGSHIIDIAEKARELVGLNRVSFAEAWLDYQIDTNLGTTFDRFDDFLDDFNENADNQCRFGEAVDHTWNLAINTRDSIESFCDAFQKVNGSYLMNNELLDKCLSSLHKWKDQMDSRMSDRNKFSRQYEDKVCKKRERLQIR